MTTHLKELSREELRERIETRRAAIASGELPVNDPDNDDEDDGSPIAVATGTEPEDDELAELAELDANKPEPPEPVHAALRPKEQDWFAVGVIPYVRLRPASSESPIPSLSLRIGARTHGPICGQVEAELRWRREAREANYAAVREEFKKTPAALALEKERQVGREIDNRITELAVNIRDMKSSLPVELSDQVSMRLRIADAERELEYCNNVAKRSTPESKLFRKKQRQNLPSD